MHLESYLYMCLRDLFALVNLNTYIFCVDSRRRIFIKYVYFNYPMECFILNINSKTRYVLIQDSSYEFNHLNFFSLSAFYILSMNAYSSNAVVYLECNIIINRVAK